jgi:outer membrane protein OmpA-like peptidoglycan-associated protein
MKNCKSQGRRWLAAILIAAAARNSAAFQEVRDLTGSDPTEEQLIEILTPKPELDDLGGARGIGMASRPRCNLKKVAGSRGLGLKTISDIAAIEVNFDYNSVEIRPDAMTKLDRLGRALASQSLSASCFQIMGHTDNKGTEAYNDRLSQARAEAVVRYLIDRFGIEPERLNAVGFGERNPMADNSTEGGRSKNRRVEIANVTS